MHQSCCIGAISNVARVLLCCFDRHCFPNYKMSRATGEFFPFTIMVGSALFHLHMPPYKYAHSDLTMIPDMGGRGLRYRRETSRCGERISEDLLCCVRRRLGGEESLH